MCVHRYTYVRTYVHTKIDQGVAYMHACMIGESGRKELGEMQWVQGRRS